MVAMTEQEKTTNLRMVQALSGGSPPAREVPLLEMLSRLWAMCRACL